MICRTIQLFLDWQQLFFSPFGNLLDEAGDEGLELGQLGLEVLPVS
jgi:hypothetical protein